jgi:hypothetical protein
MANVSNQSNVITWTETAIRHVKSWVQIFGDVNRFFECANVPKFERFVTASSRDVTVVVAERDARCVAAFHVRVAHLHCHVDECLSVVPQLKTKCLS